MVGLPGVIIGAVWRAPIRGIFILARFPIKHRLQHLGDGEPWLAGIREVEAVGLASAVEVFSVFKFGSLMLVLPR
jgi:hypothetical protein